MRIPSPAPSPYHDGDRCGRKGRSSLPSVALLAGLLALLAACAETLPSRPVPSRPVPNGMNLDPSVWKLVVDHDFRSGDDPSLYSPFCGPFSDQKGISNFSRNNIEWRDGALVLKLTRGRNVSCTRETRDYAGAGFSLRQPTAKEIAVEMEIAGTGVPGASAYAALWPARGQRQACAWGAEDDFFEEKGSAPERIWATSHVWTDTCKHKTLQKWYNIPDFAEFHRYGVVREVSRDPGTTLADAEGCVTFHLDGKPTGKYCDLFRAYEMAVHLGLGSYGTDPPTRASALPATLRLRHLRVWVKR